MRLQFNQNTTGYPFDFICLRCGVRHTSSQGYVADLDGEPFKAYYCIVCGNITSVLNDRTKGVHRAIPHSSS